MYENKGIKLILDEYAHVTPLTGHRLGIYNLQLSILNFYIQNRLADNLECRNEDEEDINKRLYLMPVPLIRKLLGLNESSSKKALRNLSNKIYKRDGINQSLFFKKKIRMSGTYLGMTTEMMWELVKDNPLLFNNQCKYFNKKEWICPFRVEQRGKKRIISDIRTMTKKTYDGDVLIMEEPMEPLFFIDKEMNESDSSKKHSEWAETLIKDICIMADTKIAVVRKRGKEVKVFSHLTDGYEFRKKRAGIDNACKLVDSICNGRFWRENPQLFGNIPQEVLDFKDVDKAKKRLQSIVGNKTAIRKFIIRCAKNYFKAIKPGMETYKQIKDSFPTDIKSFFLCTNNYGDTTVANFLLYYVTTLDASVQRMNDSMKEVEDIVGNGIIRDKIQTYFDEMKETQYLSFWLNMARISKIIKRLLSENKTSYSLSDCMEIIFVKVDELIATFGKVYAGHFDPENGTMKSALREIKNK